MKTIFSAKWSLLKMLSAGLMVVALIPSVAHADYFLKFYGIEGESKAYKHERWIDIDTFSWGVTNTGSVHPGGGGGSGKASFSDFSWSQGSDKSIIELFHHVTVGEYIKDAVVEFQSKGEKPIVYFKMTFNDVLLTKISLTGSSDSSDYDGAFSYSKVTLVYTVQKPDGSVGATSSAYYDLKQQKGSVSSVAGIYALGLMGPGIVTSVPEPETYAMLMAGLGLLGVIARRRQSIGTA